MTDTKATPSTVPSEPKLTREQRRFLQRLNKEADETFNNLFNRFFETFLNSDEPEGEEVAEALDSTVAKWKVFCHRKRLRPEVFGAMEKHCAEVVKQYTEAKAKEAASK